MAKSWWHKEAQATLPGNGNSRVEAANPFQDIPLRGDSNDGQLDDPVRNGAQTGGLQVQEGQGSIQFKGEDHFSLSLMVAVEVAVPKKK